MRQQVAHGDGLPCLGAVRKVGGDGIVELEPTVLDQRHDRGRRELLGQRGQLEDRVGRDGSVVLEVGDAVTLQLHDRAIADDGHGQARDAAGVHLALDVLVDRVGAGGRRRRQRRRGEQQDAEQPPTEAHWRAVRL